MKELSLHILDIAQNSISAKASSLEIAIAENTKENLITITIADNGKGMSEEFVKKVTDPFVTTRDTRKVGLGIPFFKMAAESTGGTFEIESRPGVGTKVRAAFVRDHIDREPLGDMGETLASLIGCNPDVSFLYEHIFDDAVFRLSTEEVKNILKDIPLNSPEIILWIKEFINEQINILYGGASV